MKLRNSIVSIIRRIMGRELSPSFYASTMEWALCNLKAGGFSPRVAIDVGAYQGEWTRLFTSIFPGTTVLMIEPQQEQEKLLQAVLHKSPLCQYRLALLGRTPGQRVDFDLNASSSKVRANGVSSQGPYRQMETQTLDIITAGTQFESPQVIKLDVQGYELEVLLGGSRALSFAEVVVMEVSAIGLIPQAPSFYDVVAFMHEHGFRLYDICTLIRRPIDMALWQVDVIFVKRTSLLGAVSLGFEARKNG